MVLLFNQRVPLVAVLELALAGIVFFAAFISILVGYPLRVTEAKVLAVAAACVFAVSQLIALRVFGLHRLDREMPVLSFSVRLVLSLLLGGACAYVGLALLPEGADYRIVLPQALLLSGGGLLFVRMILVFGVEYDLLTHRVLVVGTGQEALSVERALQEFSKSGVSLVGFYPTGSSAALSVASDRVLSTTHSLEDTISRMRVQEVIVAVHDQRGASLPVAQLLNCRVRGIIVTDLSGFFERVTGEVPVDSLKASWLIYGDGFRQNWSRRFMKRAFDMIASSILLLVSAPVMAIAALAIFLEGGRPVIYRQERVGLGGRTFNVLKFRSMCTDAERDGVPKWAATGDARVTRVGRIIRRTRIDELPQIFNVLKGEMSFVGPRPERPFFVQQLSEQVPYYGVRHTVKPGLTGWAQVKYAYGASVEDSVRKLQYDLYYVKNHSVLLDLMILLRTVRVVLMGEGAR